MTLRDFHLGILGLTQLERITVRSVCSLTHSRSRVYHVLDPEDCVDADVMLVDADDPRAVELWLASPMCRAGRPALLIGRHPDIVTASAYTMSRTGFTTRLVKSLDQIAVREFHCFADVVGGDAMGDGADDFMHTGSQPSLAALPRALVIDDAPAVQAKMSALLSLKGLSADVVNSAAQGLERLHSNRYAIVFLEVILPDLDGYTVCRRIKAADRAFTPIVMLTHRGSAFDRMRGLMAGCHRYLVKPIAMQTLNKVLHELIPAQMLAMATAPRDVSRASPALNGGEP